MTERFSSNSLPRIPEFLSGGGEMGERIRSYDWASHPLGPPRGWPQSLKVAIRIMLTSRYAMWMGWGPEFFFFCNDSYRPTLGIKKDWALGASARRVWAEIWRDIGPRAESVVRTGEATWDESLPLFLERSGFSEETFHTFSYSPLPDDSQGIGGMLCVVTEDTERVIGERRVAMLRELASDLTTVNAEDQLFPVITRRMYAHAKDIPFALLYLFDEAGTEARLAAVHGVSPKSPLAPAVIPLSLADAVWPAAEIRKNGASILLDDLAKRFRDIPTGPWEKPARQAIVVPLAQQGQERSAGFLVASINPYRPFDTDYSGFMTLLAGQIAAGLSNARAYEAERKRAEALAEIDRVKTAFFSNVSHEFRTPLTLMLGPVEEVLSRSSSRLEAEDKEQLQAVHRNSLRLLKLVNSLLDFSRIEAGRVEATYEQVDLAAFTAELASVFATTVQKAGLKFIVNCEPISDPMFVDRSMWEKIVLNLISNAYKYTFEGEIEVRLRQVGSQVELTVRDTGTGIPENHVSHIFERFYRVEGARGRTHEGTGIGLALVQELAKLHGGTVRLASEVGKGSAFTVAVPVGKEHLVQTKISRKKHVSTQLGAAPFVEEALRWSSGTHEKGVPEAVPSSEVPQATAPACAENSRGRILVADDSADMRDYVTRLLKDRYQVEAVGDGEKALEAILKSPPDLVLTDVMMPGLDGFGLLRELRNNPATSTIPVIILSARAGEEARMEGLECGADDYLIKPFSARELLSRVRSHLNMARLRREVAEVVQARERELSLIYNNASDVIFYLGAEPGERFRFLSVNPSFLQATGLAERQVAGKLVSEVIPEPSLAMVLDHYRTAIRERRTVRWEEISEYPSGRKVGLVSITPVFDAGRCINLIGTVHDITERKQAEVALRESNERISNIFTSISDSFAALDKDWRFTYMNPGYAKLVSSLYPSPQDLIGKNLWEKFPDIVGTEVEHRYRKAMQEQKADSFELFYEPLKAWLEVRMYPTPELLSLYIGDITERKKTEAALRESEERFRTMADATPTMVWVAGPDNQCIYLNKSWFEFTGRTEKQELGNGWTEGIHPDDLQRCMETYTTSFNARRPFKVEVRVRRHDGHYRWLLDHGVPRLAPDGTFMGFIGGCTDIEDQKRSEEKLESLVAERTEKLSETIQELEAFSYSVSHDMRAPLRAMQGYADALLNEHGKDLNEQATHFAERIFKNAERLDLLTRDILAYSKIAKGEVQLQSVDLRLLLQRVLPEYPQFQSPKAEILIEVLPVKVQANESYLTQVVSNLVGNAVKFVARGTTPRVRIWSEEEKGRVRVWVEDNGIGIAPHHRDRIFHIFGRVNPDKMYEGTGIGLSIVKKAVERMAGEIGFESQPGVGSRFWFTLKQA